MAGAWSKEASVGGPASSSGARGGKAVVGALLIVVGILCMVAPKISGRASVVVFGVLLGLSGLLELIGGAVQPRHHYRGLLMGGGLFSLAAGAVMVARPFAGLVALTLLLAMFFFAAGLFPLVTALSERRSGWAWEVTFGVIATLLGVLVLAGWPVSSLWLVGTLVGIEIVVRGGTLLASAYAPGSAPRAPSFRAV